MRYELGELFLFTFVCFQVGDSWPFIQIGTLLAKQKIGNKQNIGIYMYKIDNRYDRYNNIKDRELQKKATGNRRWKKRRTGNVGIEVRKEKKIIRGKGGGAKEALEIWE